MPPGHPERAERISAITNELITQGIYDLLRVVEAPEVSRDALCRVHSEALVDSLLALDPSEGLVAIDPDTYVGPHSISAARHAAGAAVEATHLVLNGEAGSAFCCVRPPGHHAESSRAMGFCLFNNVAVGAACALAEHGLERVAILDFDVHHGNGTEDIFAGDERVLFCSSFQHPFYPGTPPSPKGTNVVRATLPAASDGATFRDTITEQWGPAIDAYRPEIVFVSAGFDGHVEDEMSGVHLIDDDYRWVSDWIVDAADRHAGGRIVSCLEGGYALPALGRCATQHVRALADV